MVAKRGVILNLCQVSVAGPIGVPYQQYLACPHADGWHTAGVNITPITCVKTQGIPSHYTITIPSRHGVLGTT